jgi:hypothetical protein
MSPTAVKGLTQRSKERANANQSRVDQTP